MARLRRLFWDLMWRLFRVTRIRPYPMLENFGMTIIDGEWIRPPERKSKLVRVKLYRARRGKPSVPDSVTWHSGIAWTAPAAHEESEDGG